MKPTSSIKANTVVQPSAVESSVITSMQPNYDHPRADAAKGGGGSKETMPITEICPVDNCGRIFQGRRPRQSLWRHLASQSKSGRMQAAHKEAHKAKLLAGKPKLSAVERNRLSTARFREKHPERSSISSRLANFRWKVRREGVPAEQVPTRVAELECQWQERKAALASRHFANILLESSECIVSSEDAN